MKTYYITENDFNKLDIWLKTWDIVFLKWDLWAWKTTLSKYIVNNLLKVSDEVRSPTYTYYNKYNWVLDWKKIDIYHFDLYRLENYDEFFAIWAEEIFDNNNWIILVEWPDIIEKYYKPNITIKIEKTDSKKERKVSIE